MPLALMESAHSRLVRKRELVLILDLIISNLHLILRHTLGSPFYLPVLNKRLFSNTYQFPLKLCLAGADVDMVRNFGKLLEISGDGCMIHTIFFLDSYKHQ